MDLNSSLREIASFLDGQGMDAKWALRMASMLLSLAYLGVASAVYLILNRIVNPMILHFTRKTPTKIDDILFRHSFLKWCWWELSVLLLRHLLQYSLMPFQTVLSWVDITADVVIIGLGTKMVVEFVKGVFLVLFDHKRISEEAERLRVAEENGGDYEYVPSHSLQGLEQMIVFLIWAIGVILMLSVVVGKNPLLIISGLGAGAAVLMLVFKDSILGVVAGIQLTVNDMLRPGDWVTAPAYGANGIVQKVTLATVKVLNWDHTIVTIPPYQLVSQSFQNWRSMQESGGRRVARSLSIDMTTVRFLTQEEKKEMRQSEWASMLDLDGEVVNLTALRHYLKHYISQLPTLKRGGSMIFMVRELQPTESGLPIEIYFFTKCTAWEQYEGVQADVVDHILAIVGRFGLRIFQAPTGADIKSIAKIEQKNVN